MNWVILCIITIISWGLWGFLGKLALNHLDWTEVYFVSNLALFVSSLLVWASQKPSINVGSAGFNYAIIAGIMMALGAVTFYVALQAGKAIMVMPLTSLYLVVTIVLSYLILHEQISLTKGIGIVLAVVALVLMALE